MLKLRSLAAGRGGEDRAVIVYLDEAKPLVAALARERAAVKLASEQAAARLVILFSRNRLDHCQINRTGQPATQLHASCNIKARFTAYN